MTAMIVIGVLALGALHYFLSRRSTVWLGAVVPVLTIVSLVFFFTQGLFVSLRDWVMVVLIMVTVLKMWSDGQQARLKRLEVK